MSKFISNRAIEALAIARDEARVQVEDSVRRVKLYSIYDNSTQLHEASANVHYYAGIRDVLNLLIADQATPKMREFMVVLDTHYELRENG